jgi:hypothetical protein
VLLQRLFYSLIEHLIFYIKLLAPMVRDFEIYKKDLPKRIDLAKGGHCEVLEK